MFLPKVKVAQVECDEADLNVQIMTDTFLTFMTSGGTFESYEVVGLTIHACEKPCCASS